MTCTRIVADYADTEFLAFREPLTLTVKIIAIEHVRSKQSAHPR